MLYHSPISGDRLRIGKFCSIACGAKFLFNSANHILHSLSTYPFPLFYEAWEHGLSPRESWDNTGDIAIGSDVWIGYEAVILAGVHHWGRLSNRNPRRRHKECAALHHRGRNACPADPQALSAGAGRRPAGDEVVGLARRTDFRRHSSDSVGKP